MATTFTTKTWVDRVSEYPARRTLTDTSGNAETYTVTRNEGTVSEEGDAFSAENMNDLESRIAAAVDVKLDGEALISDYDTAVSTTTTGSAPDCTVIAEMYQNFTAGCSVIAAALNSAGVATASNASPSVMAAAIATVADNQYTSGYAAAKVGTATANRVLSGYTFTNASNVGATGNMSNRGNVTVTLNCGSSYTITNGFHGGGGTVTANSLSSQTVGNITAARVLNGYVGWANGTKYTGNMTNRGNITTTLNCGSSYTIPAGYHGGGGTVTANSLSSQTVGNITAARVLNGYVGWANGTKYTGSMNNWGSNTVTLSSSNTASLSAGYYSSVSINCASRYSNAYNAGKNAAASGVFRAGIHAGSYTNNGGASNSVTFSSNATVYYTLSLFQDGDIDSVAYIQLNGTNKANSAFDYGQVLTTGSFSVTNGSVVYMYVYSGGAYGAVSYTAVYKA